MNEQVKGAFAQMVATPDENSEHQQTRTIKGVTSFDENGNACSPYFKKNFGNLLNLNHPKKLSFS